MKMKYAVIAAAAAFAITSLISCGNKKAEQAENETVRNEESTAAAVATEAEGVMPTNHEDSLRAQYDAAFFQKPGDYKTTSTGLKYVIVKEGKGESPKPTSVVTVNYEGMLTDGTVFDSSFDRGEAIDFPLNQVIPGWTEGLQLMKPGGEAVFYIPSEIGYGETGTPGGPIPPNADLIFVVDLISVNN